MNKCCGKEKSRGLEQLRIYGNVGQFVIFKGLIRIGLTDKVIFEQSFGKRVICNKALALIAQYNVDNQIGIVAACNVSHV